MICPHCTRSTPLFSTKCPHCTGEFGLLFLWGINAGAWLIVAMLLAFLLALLLL
jgi:hypothetical protein